MSWQEAVVTCVAIAGGVATLHLVLPYLRRRDDEQRREQALREATQRIDKLESALAERRMPGLGRRTA